MFIAYDLGGSIVKDALATAASDLAQWQTVAETSRLLIFSGCPHRAASKADMENRLSSFLFADYDLASVQTPPAASSISALSAAVMEVNSLFIESKVPLRSRLISICAGTTTVGKKNSISRV